MRNLSASKADLEQSKMRKLKLDMMSEAMGRSSRTNYKKRFEFQKDFNDLMTKDEDKKKVFRTALNPDIIKQQQNAKTLKEKSRHKRQKRRLFMDFLGCGGWR